MKPHTEVEQAFSDFFGKESSLLFPSGWTANEALLKTIPTKGDLVLIDKLDHASIIDAVKSSDAQFHTYRREDMAKLEKYLSQPGRNRKFIVTESIFSMDGDTADLKALVELKKKHGAILIVDEAHAAGCVGKTGAGLAEQSGLADEVDIIIAPLGKAFAATGAIVAADKVVIDYLINTARPFIYTTAPTPANCAAILAALEIVKTEPQRRQRLSANADLLRTKLAGSGFNTASSSTHIVPVILGSAEKAVEASEKLFDAGFFVVAIRPPTVAKGTARLRISLQSDHTADQIESLASAMQQII
jgi:8-amino-7-oxononanoate synthase